MVPPPAAPHPPEQRLRHVDVARGVLLLAMLFLHVASAQAAAASASLLHRNFGIFLISAGFVALSGLIGVKGAQSASQALRTALWLLLVLFSYGVILSLFRYGGSLLAGGDAACLVRQGWTPPVRFESLGILLPVAILRAASPLAVRRGGAGLFLAAVAIVAFLGLGALTAAQIPALLRPLWGVVSGRALTPFYTASLYVALGLFAAAVATRRPSLLARMLPWPVRLLALSAAVIVSSPRLSGPALDAVYAFGPFVGHVGMFVYWGATVALFVAGFASPATSALSRMLSLLGRHSLVVFVLHLFLLEGNALVEKVFGIERGDLFAALLFVVDAAALLLAAWRLERRPATEKLRAVLLAPPTGAFSFRPSTALAVVGVLAAYSGAALAKTGQTLLVDDFEHPADCPKWWRFGTLRQERVPTHPGHALRISGRAEPGSSQGLGVYVDGDVGARRELRFDVFGNGPGSGRLKVELLDDDNGNWQVEKDEHFVPASDDRFVAELQVDWRGWRQVSLPVTAFRDDNPGRGNDRYDPTRDFDSGGLLELQLLFSPGALGQNHLDLQLDNLRWHP